MSAETQVKVLLLMSVPTVDRQDAEKKAIAALVNSGAMSVTTPFGASILDAKILPEEE